MSKSDPNQAGESVLADVDNAIMHVIGKHSKMAALALTYRAHFARYYVLLGWHYWTGKVWTPDTELASISSVVKDAAEHYWTLARGNREIEAAVKTLDSTGGIVTVINQLKLANNVLFSTDMADADPYLLNTQSGVVDLRTLDLEAHHPDQHHTKITSGSYDPDCDQSLWLSFMEQVQPDEEMRTYLQKLAGLSLLGEVELHIMPILIGSGGNGKGTFVETLAHALGDYATVVPSALFMTVKDNAEAASPAVAALRGKRLAIGSETEERQRLAGALVKQLTGGDTITARQLYKEPIVFQPSHTFMMVTNHLPLVRGDDEAIWQRLAVVPFDIKIRGTDMDDPQLKSKLFLQADAIVTWAVQGYALYREEGLKPPKRMRDATTEFRSESDPLSRFIEDNLEFGSGYSVSRRELSEYLLPWLRTEGVSQAELSETVAQRQLYSKLEHDHKCDQKKTAKERLFLGVRIQQTPTQPEGIDEL